MLVLTYPDARRFGARPSSFVSQLPRRSQYLPPLEPPDRCSSLRGSPLAGVPLAVSRACAVIGGLAVAAAIAAAAAGAGGGAGAGARAVIEEEEGREEDKWLTIRSRRSRAVFGMDVGRME